jgi:hypothetical protein
MVSFMLECGVGLARGRLQATVVDSVIEEKEEVEEGEEIIARRSMSSEDAGLVAMLGIFINAFVKEWKTGLAIGMWNAMHDNKQKRESTSEVALLETRVV